MFRPFRLSLILLLFLFAIQLWAGPELDLYEALLEKDAYSVEAILEGNPELLNMPNKQVYQVAFGDYIYSSQGLSPLLFTIEYNLDSMTRLLLNLGADPNSLGADGRYPLHRAAFLGETILVRWLLEAGALREAGGEDQHTALTWALSAGRWNTADFLIERGARLYKTSPVDDPLVEMVYSRKITMRDALSITDSGLSSFLLIDAAKRGQYDVLYRLLLQNNDPDTRDSGGVSPLMAAVFEGQIQEAELLLEFGADPNIADINELRPLYIAAARGDLKMMELLYQYGAGLNRGEYLEHTALFAALVYRRKAALEWLLVQGVEVNRRCSETGATPLMIASWLGDRWSVEELLYYGAASAVGDFNGDNAIYYALRAYNKNSGVNYYSIIDRLIQSGVDSRRYASQARDSRFRSLLEARWQ